LRAKQKAPRRVPRARLAIADSVRVLTLHALTTFLRFYRQRGSRTGQQALQADRLAGVFAVTVVAFLNQAQGGLDFLQQLAFAVAGAQLQRVLFFQRGSLKNSRWSAFM